MFVQNSQIQNKILDSVSLSICFSLLRNSDCFSFSFFCYSVWNNIWYMAYFYCIYDWTIPTKRIL